MKTALSRKQVLNRLKRRSKKGRGNRKRLPNVLKFDPTRTITLRKKMAAEVKRRFARLKLDLVKLVLQDDAFGLKEIVHNAFCPTGEGGGIDPSCSPQAMTVLLDDNKEYIATFQADGKGFFFQAAKSHDGWDIGFGEEEKLGKGVHTAAMTHDPNVSPVKVLRGVERSLDAFIKSKQPDKFAFTAAKYEGSRVKFYDRIANEIGKVHGYSVETADYPAVKEYILRKSQTTNAPGEWRFRSDPEKLKAFQEWLKRQINRNILKEEEDKLWEQYIMEGFAKGAGRSFDDVKQREGMSDKLDFYQGSRQQFLKDTFARPIAVDKVKLIASRAYGDLEGVTSAMATKMQRTLADGLVQGKGPREVARDLANDVDGIGRNRALVIARTETIRAHAEGQLEALDQLGVEEVGVAVEWSTTGDERVCELCEPLEGVVLKLDEARGMLPRHPNCRCAWIPAGVGEDDENQKDSKKEIDRAVKLSIEREGKKGGDDEEDDWKWGPGKSISKDRPESILNYRDEQLGRFSSQLFNVFCTTGEGGGVDPTCSPNDAATLSELSAKYPHPGPSPNSPPGLGRPDLVAKSPELQQALKDRDEWGSKYHTTRTVDLMTRMLTGKLKLPPDPSGERTDKDLRRYGKRAKDAEYETSTDLGGLGSEFRAFHDKVAASHPEASNLLERAKVEAQRRYDRASETWSKYKDALRERGLTRNEEVENVFCPTGEGGGIDATCSPGGSTSERTALEASVQSAYDRLYGAGAPKLKYKERKELDKQYKADLAKLQSLKGDSISTKQPTPTGANHTSAIAEAFQRIGQEKNSPNFVSLVDLRKALPGVSREDFDKTIHQMRVDRILTLTAAEGRHGLTSEELAASIKEPGAGDRSHNLLFASVVHGAEGKFKEALKRG